MASFAELIQQGGAQAWLFIPSAILLGALHGLEPGHSKTMMAAFIVAVRGTVAQAALLGLAATVSHTLIVWIVAIGGMVLWQGVEAEAIEPIMQLASAVIVIGIALWMLHRTWQDQQRARAFAGLPANDHGHHHAHGHDHHHGHDRRHDHGHAHGHDHGHTHGHPHHHHDRGPGQAHGLEVTTDGWQDTHGQAHADDIRRRFGDRNVTTWQILLFGLTGGLIPCPAAITVLLLCLQLDQLGLGFVLVLCFSIGLAITLMTVGAAAALGVRHAERRWSWFSSLARRAPYASAVLIILVGLYLGWHGVAGLAARAG